MPSNMSQGGRPDYSDGYRPVKIRTDYANTLLDGGGIQSVGNQRMPDVPIGEGPGTVFAAYDPWGHGGNNTGSKSASKGPWDRRGAQKPTPGNTDNRGGK